MYARGTEPSKYAMQPANMQAEMEHLEEVFHANGFPERLVKRALSCAPESPPRGPPREDDDPEEETPKLLCVPYVRGVSEKLEKVCTPL